MILHNIGHSVTKRLASGLELSRVSSRSRLGYWGSRSRLGGIFQCLGLEAERLGSRLGLGHEGLVSIPGLHRTYTRCCLLFGRLNVRRFLSLFSCWMMTLSQWLHWCRLSILRVDMRLTAFASLSWLCQCIWWLNVSWSSVTQWCLWLRHSATSNLLRETIQLTARSISWHWSSLDAKCSYICVGSIVTLQFSQHKLWRTFLNEKNRLNVWILSILILRTSKSVVDRQIGVLTMKVAECEVVACVCNLQ